MSASALEGFQFKRILHEDPQSRRIVVLGTAPAKQTDAPSYGDATTQKTSAENPTGAACDAITQDQVIVIMEKTAFDKAIWTSDQQALHNMFTRLNHLGQNDIYTWLLGWTAASDNTPADVKVTVIRPATETHIRKYSQQDTVMVQETPQLYRTKVLPWIVSQPTSRIQWVFNILEGKTQETVLHDDPDPLTGFVILPDLKWDQKTLSALYMTAIVRDPSLRSLRDLRPVKENPQHSKLLCKIRDTGRQIAEKRYGLRARAGGGEAVKCFLHYHPSYYHMHVHIIAANYVHPTVLAGRAHLLDDVLDLLHLGVDFEERTFTHALAPTTDLGLLLLGDRGSD